MLDSCVAISDSVFVSSILISFSIASVFKSLAVVVGCSDSTIVFVSVGVVDSTVVSISVLELLLKLCCYQ